MVRRQEYHVPVPVPDPDVYPEHTFARAIARINLHTRLA